MIQKPFMRSALLTALLAVSAGTARANTTYSNKNILMHRAQLTNLAMEYTTWHGHVYDMMPSAMHSNLQFVPFFQGSEAKKDLAQYFGIGNGSDTFKLGLLTDYPGGAPAAVAGVDVDAPLIIHDPLGAGAGAASAYQAAATVKIAPEQEQYGVRLDYFQDINSPVKNMFLRVSTAAVHVQNNMHMTLPVVVEENVNGIDLTIADFLSGAGDNTQQAALTKAKMGGRRSAFGFADVNFSLGHKCLQTDRSHAFFSVDVTVPTGNRVQADYAFAPMYGNGRHFGLGASFDGGLHVWRNDHAAIRFSAAARYKYLFENNEERTLSLSNSAKGTTGVQSNMSKYYLVGKAVTAGAAAAPLVPLANISSMPVSVKPGHQLDLLASMSLEASKFTFDVGYNPFWKDGENVYVKNFADSGKYAVAAKNFNATNAFVAGAATGAAVGYVTGNELTLADFDLNSITTPSLLSHKLFAGAGYSWRAYESTNMSVGLGGSYEFASSNADLENFALWAKFNVSF